MIGRGQREGVAAEFLRDVLAGGPLGVPKLEAMARTAGLLGEGQRITHAKVFKKAKKSLGIRSVRNGFGDAGDSATWTGSAGWVETGNANPTPAISW
jgi:hypothetical protein